MKPTLLNFLLIVAASHATCQPSPLDSEIAGRIAGTSAKVIRIGEIDVPLSADGGFRFKTELESPRILSAKVGTMTWSIFLAPGKLVELEVEGIDVSTLKYTGDLASSNSCLKKLCTLDAGTDEFFNNNWTSLHAQDESRFIAVIDSVKMQYLGYVIAYQTEAKDVVPDFVKLIRAEINFGFNALVIDYPETRRRMTGERLTLSPAGRNYLNAVSIDDTTLMHVEAFQKYCRKWIDYNADLLVSMRDGRRHYNLRKMDVLPKVLSSVFSSSELRDFWYSEYLREHIENAGPANSGEYVEVFDRICANGVYRQKIDRLYASALDSESDHVVKCFKTAYDFKLHAHIFYPEHFVHGDRIPAIVIFHGGGFVLGNPSWAFGKARHYAHMGLIAIAAQYRLSNFRDVTPIEAIQDAKDLMIWLRQNKDTLGICADKIATSGWSVGAQLCATLAVFPDTLPHSNVHSSPNALLLTSPGTGTRGWFAELLRGTKVNPQDYSPIDHVRPGLPPTIILQGRDDTVTPLEDVKLFHDRLTENGDYCEMWTYDGVGHLFTPTYLGDSGWPQPDEKVQAEADQRSDEFLAKFGFLGQ